MDIRLVLDADNLAAAASDDEDDLISDEDEEEEELVQVQQPRRTQGQPQQQQPQEVAAPAEPYDGTLVTYIGGYSFSEDWRDVNGQQDSPLQSVPQVSDLQMWARFFRRRLLQEEQTRAGNSALQAGPSQTQRVYSIWTRRLPAARTLVEVDGSQEVSSAAAAQLLGERLPRRRVTIQEESQGEREPAQTTQRSRLEPVIVGRRALHTDVLGASRLLELPVQMNGTRHQPHVWQPSQARAFASEAEDNPALRSYLDRPIQIQVQQRALEDDRAGVVDLAPFYTALHHEVADPQRLRRYCHSVLRASQETLASQCFASRQAILPEISQRFVETLPESEEVEKTMSAVADISSPMLERSEISKVRHWVVVQASIGRRFDDGSLERLVRLFGMAASYLRLLANRNDQI